MTLAEAWSVWPCPSSTVSVTVRVPADAYVCDGLIPVPVCAVAEVPAVGQLVVVRVEGAAGVELAGESRRSPR